MQPHQRLTIAEPSQVGDARRRALALAVQLELGETVAGRVALVINELGNNLLQHAGRGELLLGPSRGGIDVLSLDLGPGMDVQRCLRDGFSSGSTPGTGLGAVKRLADEFSAYSLAGRGSVIATHFDGPDRDKDAAPAGFRIAGINTAAPGEHVSGDGWGVHLVPDGRLALLVADGLGHGPIAAEASDAALSLVRRVSPGVTASAAATLTETHDRLRSTRGAAVALALVQTEPPRLTYCGAGNIVGRLISGVSDRTLLSQHGTLGVQVRSLQDVHYDWPDHAMLVMHSDGIVTRWTLDDAPGLLQCEPAVVAGWILRDHFRGGDDATVVVVQLR